MRELTPEPLTAEAFAPFGHVIETSDAARQIEINQGHAIRYDRLAEADVGDGVAAISIFRARPLAVLELKTFERHPLGSQAFFPIGQARCAVIVAPPGDTVRVQDLRAFIVEGNRGVNYHPGTWHHVLLTLDAPGDFLVIDRGGPGHNCDEFHFAEGEQLVFALHPRGAAA